MNYQWAYRFIDDEKIHTIFEVGTRDCFDSVDLATNFPNAEVYCFEANPDYSEMCRATIASSEFASRIHFVPKAVSDSDGIVNFWKCESSEWKGAGIGSLYPIDFSRRENVAERTISLEQTCIPVDSTRIDTYCRENGMYPNLLCMDIQEAELLALKGCGDFLTKIEYIVLEASLQGTYQGGCVFQELSEYLDQNGFQYVYSPEYRFDIPPKEIPETGFQFFDCLFWNPNVNSGATKDRLPS